MQVTKNLGGALIGPLGLRLAQSGNIVSGTAGVALLTGLGVLSIRGTEEPKPKPDDQGNLSCPEGYEMAFDPISGEQVCYILEPSGPSIPELPPPPVIPPYEPPPVIPQDEGPPSGYDFWFDPDRALYCAVNNITGIVYCNGNQNQVEMWAARGG